MHKSNSEGFEVAVGSYTLLVFLPAAEFPFRGFEFLAWLLSACDSVFFLSFPPTTRPAQANSAMAAAVAEAWQLKV